MMENEIVVFKAGAECKFFIGGPTEEVCEYTHYYILLILILILILILCFL